MTRNTGARCGKIIEYTTPRPPNCQGTLQAIAFAINALTVIDIIKINCKFDTSMI